MRILFEEHHYPISVLQEHLDAGYYTNVGADNAKTTFVGYYYSQRLNDSVFILPKVFIQIQEDNKRELVFGQEPEKIIDLTEAKIDEKDKNIIFALSVWIYLAIKRYAENNDKIGITFDEHVQNVISGAGEKSSTYLDIILQLIRFHREHGQLLAFTTMMSKKHNHRVCWTKTINRRQPILQNNVPIYMDTICKTKELDLDEELIVLFYSVLKYLQQKFCFSLTFELNYNLYPASKIESLIESGGGMALLKQIRHKYFKDVFVQLWNLLYVFFDKSNQIESSTAKPDVLIAKDFNRVFEVMVDQLVSDSETTHLKNLKDGKIIDHIFKYKSVISERDNDVYYILDSKYYKDGHSLDEKSIYKQFTYAKNILQDNVGKVVVNGKEVCSNKDKPQYRDELTDGYDITPNFFIRGNVYSENNEYILDQLMLEATDNTYQVNHFGNRLFDRDTLMALEYKANFLYILISYVQDLQDSGIKETFRNAFIDKLNEKYVFYKIDFNTKDELERFVRQNFKELNGKIIRRTKYENDCSLLMAEEKLEPDSWPILYLKCGRIFYKNQVRKLTNANSSM